MSYSIVNGVLFITASIYYGDAYFSVYEVAMNNGVYHSFNSGSPKINIEPISVVTMDLSLRKKIFSGLISPWKRLF